MRIAFLLALSACGNDTRLEPDAPTAPDASIPDAPPVCPGMLEQCSGTCVNTRTDDDHCGSCANACTPAARCESAACGCPAPFLGGAHQVLGAQMIAAQPGYVSGGVGLVGHDSANHVAIVTASQFAPLNTPIQVNLNNVVFAGLSYQLVTATQARAGYLASAGTVTLTRRCANGIAGTMQNLTLVEVDVATLQPIPGGCTTTVSSLAFDVGGACL